MTTLLAFLFLGSLVTFVWGLIRPSHFSKFTAKKLTRKHTGLGFGLLAFVLFMLVGATAPQQDKTVQLQEAAAKTSAPQENVQKDSTKQTAQPKIETKQVIETKPVAFATTTRNDTTLPKGQTKVVQEGREGVETFVYTVTYANGVETARELSSQSISAQPVEKIVATGTYEAPKSSVGSTGSGGYTNVDGDHVQSPSSDPTGATAQCGDGTYSYSQHRSGTCSHHGGVSRWL